MLRTIAHHGMIYRLGPGIAAGHDPLASGNLTRWNALPAAAARLLCRWITQGHDHLTLAGLDRLRTAAGLTEFETGLAIAQLTDLLLVIVSPHTPDHAAARPSNRAA